MKAKLPLAHYRVSSLIYTSFSHPPKNLNCTHFNHHGKAQVLQVVNLQVWPLPGIPETCYSLRSLALLYPCLELALPDTPYFSPSQTSNRCKYHIHKRPTPTTLVKITTLPTPRTLYCLPYHCPWHFSFSNRYICYSQLCQYVFLLLTEGKVHSVHPRSHLCCSILQPWYLKDSPAPNSVQQHLLSLFT